MIKLITNYLSNRSKKKNEEKQLEKYGWDGKCPGCNKWLHRETNATIVSETEWHWHYLCSCGKKSAWGLWAMIPMLDLNYDYENNKKINKTDLLMSKV